MLKLKPLIAAKAKESYKSNVGRPSKSPQNSATISNVETRKELSKLAGVSLLEDRPEGSFQVIPEAAAFSLLLLDLL